MSDSEAVDRIEIRRQIKSFVESEETARQAETLNEVAADMDVPHDAVRNEFDVMERNGFLYTVGSGTDAEVKLP